MSAQPAQLKTGGRKKGTPNKKTLLLAEILAKKNVSIPGKLIEILPDLKPDKQADVLLKLMEYIYPKRKALDMSHSTEPKSTHSAIMELIELKKAELS